jgi:hypothetical protein
MEKHTELTNMRSKDPAMSMDWLDEQTRQTVLRLLDRQSYQLENVEVKEDKRGWIYVDPSSAVVLGWNLFFLAGFYLLQLQIPITLACGVAFFQNEVSPGSVYRPVYLALWVLMLLDILFNCFKGYHAFGKGKVVDDQLLILRHYLTSQFPLDLLTLGLYTLPLFEQSFYLNLLQIVTAALLWVKKYSYQA